MMCKIFDEKHFVHRCAMVILILRINQLPRYFPSNKWNWIAKTYYIYHTLHIHTYPLIHILIPWVRYKWYLGVAVDGCDLTSRPYLTTFFLLIYGPEEVSLSAPAVHSRVITCMVPRNFHNKTPAVLSTNLCLRFWILNIYGMGVLNIQNIHTL